MPRLRRYERPGKQKFADTFLIVESAEEQEFMGWALLVAAAIAATLQIMLPGTTKRWLLWTAFLMPIWGAVVASFAYLSKLLHAV